MDLFACRWILQNEHGGAPQGPGPAGLQAREGR